MIAEFQHEVDRPVMTVADILALSDDDADLPDAVPAISKAPTSGGSTGRPKLILAGQPGLSPEVTPAEGGFRLRPVDTVMLPAPLYHNAPFGMMMSSTQLGAHLVLTPRFDPEGTLAEAQARKATWLYLVPTMMNRIWHLPAEVRGRYDLSSVQTLWHMAAPCPAWLKEAFIHWIAPGEVMELYAGTEAQAITIITGSEWLTHRGSVGKVTFGEMKVVGDDGAELPPGEVGEIYMRRAAGAPETYKYLGATARTLRRRLGEPWRPRLVRRRGLSVPRRPADRHDPGGGIERLSGRDRGGAGGAPGGAVLRGDRPAGRRPGRAHPRHRQRQGRGDRRGPDARTWTTGW